MINYGNLSELISKNAVRHPDRKCMYYYDDAYTYAEIDEKVNHAARVLAENGVKAGDKVGILIGNSPEYVIAFFAVVRLGAVAVPLNIFLKQKEISLNFNDCRADYFITTEHFADVAKDVIEMVPSIKRTFSFENTSFKSVNINKANPKKSNGVAADISRSDLAMLIYTSGTTGRAKGVMLTHGNLLTNAWQYTLVSKMDSNDLSVAVLPLFHAYAFLTCIVTPFYMSCAVIIFGSIQDVSKAEFKIYLDKYKPTILIGVPQLYSALARKKLTAEEQAEMPFRLYISGGAPLPVETIDRFYESYGKHIVEGYGLSEASPVAAFNPLDKTKPGTIGLILPEMEYKILDENGNKAGVNQPGELVIRGGNVMKGYWGLTEETAKVLDADGWLRTGDVATVDEDEYISIVDRIKDLIISKGMNIYPREIEEYLYRHPAIQHAAVIGVPEKDGNELVVAYVQVNPGETLTEQDVKRYIKDNFANYKVPKTVIFTDNIPVNPSGKVLKRELRERAQKAMKL